MWSANSTGPDGSFVRDEATRALRRGVYLPVRLDPVDPPLGFGETQALPRSVEPATAPIRAMWPSWRPHAR